MGAQPVPAASRRERDDPVGAERLYLEGFAAGLIGAATLALWFFALDLARGRPLYTPSLLGTALFRRGQLLGPPQSLPVSLEMVVGYTWFHGLVLCVFGVAASRLLALAERHPNAGFGIVLLCAVFEFGFLVAATLFAEPVLHALTVPAILIGNALAATAMGVFFWWRRPDLRIWP